MYRAFYEMERTPFAGDIPPGQLYESAAMADVLGRLCYVADRQLFAVVTADAGCGNPHSSAARICDGTLMYASQQNKRLTDEHLVR